MQMSNQPIKRNQEIKKKAINLYFTKFIKNLLNVVGIIDLKIKLIRYCQNISADLEKGLAHNTTY